MSGSFSPFVHMDLLDSASGQQHGRDDEENSNMRSSTHGGAQTWLRRRSSARFTKQERQASDEQRIRQAIQERSQSGSSATNLLMRIAQATDFYRSPYCK